MTNQITTKEVIDRLREISEKQEISIQRKIRALEREKKMLTEEPCKICGDAVVRIIEHSKNMIDNTETLREMYRKGLYQTRIGKLIHTRDDIEAKINTNKCFIEKNFDMYNRCCKEGKLPTNDKFRC